MISPFDVRLPVADEADNDIRTVVQPDIIVVCDQQKFDVKGCRGAPDLAIEVLSPSTASKDHLKKRELYEKHGVREYWLVHPTDKNVMVYQRQAGGFFGVPKVYTDRGMITTPLFPGLEIDLKEIFPKETAAVREAARPFLPPPKRRTSKKKS